VRDQRGGRGIKFCGREKEKTGTLAGVNRVILI